jgi:CRISPR-associated endonuclease/helicase Cas3
MERSSAASSTEQMSAAFTAAFQVATGGHDPHRWQESLALREEPASVIVAETGTGKTEAVILDWLWRRRLSGVSEERRRTPRRLVFTLPMRVLVEQTIRRVRRLLDRLRMDSLLDPDDEIGVFQLVGGAAEDDWTSRPSDDLVLVGTVDMLLSRALNRGYARGRARWPIDFGLLNTDTLFVLDEVQLLDAAVATSAQLAAFRGDPTMGGTPQPARTLWMSATLTRAWLATADHPLPPESSLITLTDDDEEGSLRRRLRAKRLLVRERAELEDTVAVADIVEEAHGQGRPAAGEGAWLTIAMCNTVERARRLRDALADRRPAGEVMLLHSRFRPGDRARLVARLEEQPGAAGRILVTTQVIEAGVDLDASALVTEPAPWASLVQRAGRLNREGLRRTSRMVVLDPSGRALGREQTAPYPPEAVERARVRLLELVGEDFSPAFLRAYREREPSAVERLLGPAPETLLLRRRDVLALFDTDPTLDGDDTDVSAFIRTGEDLDVGVAWRSIGGSEPKPDEPAARRDEICPVPISRRRDLARLHPWRWSYVRRRWEQVQSERDVRPGETLLVAAHRGGYDPELGFDPAVRTPVEPPPPEEPLDEGEPPDSDAEDPGARAGSWLTLREHTDNVVRELKRDLERMELPHAWVQALRCAARLHDAGKAHPRFQERLRQAAGEPPDRGVLWAKAPLAHRLGRQPVFRHEVASALLTLRDAAQDERDLVAYLVAAHHGKLRLTPRTSADDPPDGRRRCLGVTEGDPLPAVHPDGQRPPLDLGDGVVLEPVDRLDLSVFDIGSEREPVWIDRTLDLLDRLGPFSLAYLEALVRAADERASAREREHST